MSHNSPVPDLDYHDPLEPVLDTDRLLSHARRAKRRRRIASAAGVAAVVSALSLLAATTIGQWGQGTQVPTADPVYQLHRPSDPLVIVDHSLPRWISFVYVSKDDQICGGSAATSGSPLATTCWISVEQAATGTWVMKPIFQALPTPQDHDDQAFTMGLLRCPATTVEITFRGHHVTVPTVPVPVHGLSGLSAYAAWLPLDGATSYGWSDVTSVRARDRTGAVRCQAG